MVLKGLAALLLLGGIVYALLSGNRGIGAIAFGLGAAVLRLDRFPEPPGLSDRAGLAQVQGFGRPALLPTDAGLSRLREPRLSRVLAGFVTLLARTSRGEAGK